MRDEFRRFLTVTNYTFIEIYKSRILLNVIFLGFALVFVSYVASEFTFGVPQRVALDFGLGLLSFSGIGIAIFMGVGLLAKELESRTIYMILSRPISRYSFLLGRVVGLALILLINISVLGCVTVAFYNFLGGQFDALIGWVILFTFMESLMMLMVVILFSLITNTVRSVLFSLAVFVGGHTVTDPTIVPYIKDNNLIAFALKTYSYVFPDFTKINYKMFVIYQQSVPWNNLLLSFTYSSIYLLILAAIAVYIFGKKDLN